LTGLGTAGATQAAKSYVSELASPKHRGLCVGIYSSTFYIGKWEWAKVSLIVRADVSMPSFRPSPGSLLAAGMSIGTGKLASDWSWRIPCFVQVRPRSSSCAYCLVFQMCSRIVQPPSSFQVLFPLINVSWILFAPESPRWLVSRGRSDEAVRVLARFHSRDNDINSPLVQLELREIQEDINMAGADKRWWDFRVLFRTRANRYRIALAVLREWILESRLLPRPCQSLIGTHHLAWQLLHATHSRDQPTPILASFSRSRGSPVELGSGY
jgi:MFS family permease